MKISFFCSWILLLLVSCGNRVVISNLEQFLNQEIIIPDDMRSIVNGIDSLPAGFKNAPIKLIVYYDSLDCTLCHIKGLYKWDGLINEGITSREFKLYFIIAPKETDRSEIIMMTQTSCPDYPVFIDGNIRFSQLNPSILQGQQYHTFLLDRNNRVVLVGNPLASDGMWKLFRSTLDNMLAHGGEYVSE